MIDESLAVEAMGSISTWDDGRSATVGGTLVRGDSARVRPGREPINSMTQSIEVEPVAACRWTRT